jgi:hypothetical protein
MMNSRGDPPVQATALAVLLDIGELLRDSEKTLPANIAEFREAAATAKAAQAEFESSRAEHTARIADIEQRTKELQQSITAVKEREAKCDSLVEAVARKRDDLDVQTTMLAARKSELDRQESILNGDREAFKAAMLLHAADLESKTKAAADQVMQLQYASEASIRQQTQKAGEEILAQRAKAEAEYAVAKAELQSMQINLASREDALHKERARLSALLKD